MQWHRYEPQWDVLLLLLLFFAWICFDFWIYQWYKFASIAGLNPRSKDKAPALTDCSTPQQIHQSDSWSRPSQSSSLSIFRLFRHFFFSSFKSSRLVAREQRHRNQVGTRIRPLEISSISLALFLIVLFLIFPLSSLQALARFFYTNHSFVYSVCVCYLTFSFACGSWYTKSDTMGGFVVQSSHFSWINANLKLTNPMHNDTWIFPLFPTKILITFFIIHVLSHRMEPARFFSLPKVPRAWCDVLSFLSLLFTFSSLFSSFSHYRSVSRLWFTSRTE